MASDPTVWFHKFSFTIPSSSHNVIRYDDYAVSRQLTLATTTHIRSRDLRFALYDRGLLVWITSIPYAALSVKHPGPFAMDEKRVTCNIGQPPPRKPRTKPQLSRPTRVNTGYLLLYRFHTAKEGVLFWPPTLDTPLSPLTLHFIMLPKYWTYCLFLQDPPSLLVDGERHAHIHLVEQVGILLSNEGKGKVFDLLSEVKAVARGRQGTGLDLESTELTALLWVTISLQQNFPKPFSNHCPPSPFTLILRRV